jgi:hypothetical protein
MASSRKIDDFSSYQDFILFFKTTSPQQLHGARRARAAACLRAQAASMTMHAAARGARASERSMRALWRAAGTQLLLHSMAPDACWLP